MSSTLIKTLKSPVPAVEREWLVYGEGLRYAAVHWDTGKIFAVFVENQNACGYVLRHANSGLRVLDLVTGVMGL